MIVYTYIIIKLLMTQSHVVVFKSTKQYKKGIKTTSMKNVKLGIVFKEKMFVLTGS